jgi:uncharacterized damage-inducible protein DinB
MSYRAIDDFAKDWTHESESTLKVLDALTDASLAQKMDPEGRTLGFLAWHVTQTIPEMLGHAGVSAKGPSQEAAVPSKARAIRDAYAAAAPTVVPAVRAAWNDAQLFDKVPMYGQSWEKRVVLSAFLHHQTHHRGQMTVLMRQAGLRVPGIIGPAREDWAVYGMPTAP